MSLTCDSVAGSRSLGMPPQGDGPRPAFVALSVGPAAHVPIVPPVSDIPLVR